MNPLPSLALCLLFASAPPAPQPIRGYLNAEVKTVEKNFLGGATTLAQWRKLRPTLHRQYLDMLGLWPLPKKTPLKATVTGTLDAGGGTVLEKLHFQSKPGLYVTGNLYRPVNNKKKLPGILYVCGHSYRGRNGNKAAYQDHGLWFARNGYVCLVVDTLQLGEIAGKHHGTYNLERWWWHSAGYTPAGVECWNGIRAIDYLISRSDVDPDRIGVTGISGGGASTVWIAAADDRVKVAVPVSGMSDLKSYVSHRVINGHCDCMFLYNNHRWAWATIAALIAPRPLLFANSDNDPIFPMDGNRRIIARLRQAYKLHGKGALVDDFVSVGGHAYRPDLRRAIFRFINKHLKKDNSPVSDAPRKGLLPEVKLRVFPADKDIPKDALNAVIDRTFVPRAALEAPAAGKFAEWKKGLMKELRSRVFRSLPEKVPDPTSARPDPEGGLLVTTEPAIRCWLSPVVQKGAKGRPGVLVVLSGKEKSVPAWLAKEVAGHEVRLFVPRTSWPRRSPPNTVERSFALLGLTDDGGRVRDIAAAVRWLAKQEPKRDWSVAGKGTAGVLGAYSALFEPAIKSVIAVSPPATHLHGPHFLSVLRILDIPDALGMLAPRPLTLVDARGKAFARTEAIYKSAGAKLTRKYTPRTRIEPEGIPGLLVLCGEGDNNLSALSLFLTRAGGAKAELVILADLDTTAWANKLAGRFKEGFGLVKPASVRVLFVDARRDLTAEVAKATGVWVVSGETGLVRRALGAVKRRPLGASGSGCGPVARWLPDSLVEVRKTGATKLPALLKDDPALVGYEIGPGGALIVIGRRVYASGVAIHLGEVPGRKARRLTPSLRRPEDLTTLRRAARDRAEGFPPGTVGEPVLPSGSLIIDGGGKLPPGVLARFVKLAGGKKAKIVVLPTANPDPLPKRIVIQTAFRKLGAAKVTLLPGRRRDQVESKETLAALAEATGIWFGGGRQWRYVDAYEGTKALPLFFDVLKRGGVIGGGSAGATIQGDYLCRGGVFHNFQIAYEGYERGFAFLPGTAIDQHFSKRKRFGDMTALMKLYPRYLGIGLDESTAIVVSGSVAEVVGLGKAHFFDARKPAEQGKPDHVSLGAGKKYDLKARKIQEAKR